MKHLKKITPVFLLVLFLVMPFAHAKEANEPATITVQGSSQLDVTPDVAYIQLAVVTEAATVSAAQKENSAVANQVYNRLIAAGIAKDHFKTIQYSVIPLYQESTEKNNGVPVIRGYQIINGFDAAVSPERAGEIIDLALQAGVNQVQTIRFGKIDEADAKNIVLQMAVKDAMSKAEAVAAALGKRIGRVQTVNESGIYVQAPEFDRLNKAAYGAATPISPGYLHLSANIQLVVEIE